MPEGWGAKLQGHAFDLLDWSKTLCQPFDPWVERVAEQEGEAYVLRAEFFDGFDHAEQVHGVAIPLIAQLNGAMSVSRGSEAVEFAGVVRFAADGTHNSYYFAEMHARARARASATASVTGADGEPLPVPAPQKSDTQRWLEASQQSDDVADLLSLIGRPDNWYDLYKVIELLSRLAGGWHALRASPEAKAVDLDDIKQTANYYRHARAPKPRREVTLHEAKNGVLRIAVSVLH